MARLPCRIEKFKMIIGSIGLTPLLSHLPTQKFAQKFGALAANPSDLRVKFGGSRSRIWRSSRNVSIQQLALSRQRVSRRKSRNFNGFMGHVLSITSVERTRISSRLTAFSSKAESHFASRRETHARLKPSIVFRLNAYLGTSVPRSHSCEPIWGIDRPSTAPLSFRFDTF